MLKRAILADMMLFIATFVVIYFFIGRAAEKAPKIRTIPALEAIDEIVGRAAEMNKPIHMCGGATSAGMGDMAGTRSAILLAGISTLQRVAEIAARYKSPLFYTSTIIETQPLVVEVMESAYRSQGAEEYFNPDEQVIMTTPRQHSWSAMAMNLMAQKEVAANIMIGSFGGDFALLIEAGAALGAMQLTGTPGTDHRVAIAAGVADHVLFGSEIYGAAAMASQEPAQMGSLVGEDIIKLGITIIIILGFIAVNFGSEWFIDLLNL